MSKNKLSLGLLINDIDKPYQKNLFENISDLTSKLGHNLIIFSDKKAHVIKSKKAIFNTTHDLPNIKDIDGLIISAGTFNTPLDYELFNNFITHCKEIPKVCISNKIENIPSVVIDNEEGMRELIEHLIVAHNYKKFAFIKGPEMNYDAKERYDTFIKVLNENKTEIDTELIIQGDFTFKSGYTAAESLITNGIDFDVVVATNDLMALGAIEALNKNGIFVPFNKAIVGFGDIEIKWHSMLPLTTVKQPAGEQAETSISLLIEEISNNNNKETKKLIKLPTSLVIRESCGCSERNNTANIDLRGKHKDKLSKSVYKLRKTMIGFIQTLSHAIEARDPYTAGHQKRVSNLARCIAQRLKLSSDQIESIRMAALIHDLGKIFVPAEILNKPGKLKNNEFNLIKDHPVSGHEILKDIDFPWPVADIILQHHEKIDGTGYPKGLKNKEIMLEARILCVADVVEAMSSHRPYRPSLGINSALEEINKNSGKFYDKKVVTACLELFRNNKIDW